MNKLDEKLTELIAARQLAEAQAEQERQSKLAEASLNNAREFTQAFERDLAELKQWVEVTIGEDSEVAIKGRPARYAASFQDGDALYVLRFALTKLFRNSANWSLHCRYVLGGGIATQALMVGREVGQILEVIAETRQKMNEQALCAAEHAKQQAEAHLWREQDRQEAEHTDAEIRALLNMRTAKEVAARWRWPEGFALTLYQVTWCVGVFRNEDGESEADYARGYTPQAEAAPDGYLKVYRGGSLNKAHELRLMSELHLPVWERLIVKGVDELPAALTEDACFYAEGIALRGGLYHYVEGGRPRIVLGSQPLAWIRELVGAETSR